MVEQYIPRLGFEPRKADPLTTIVFTTITVCGLDFTFTMSFDLGASHQVSTPSLTGLARYCHLKGSTEFERFYSKGFPLGTPVWSLLLYQFNYLGSWWLDQNLKRAKGLGPSTFKMETWRSTNWATLAIDSSVINYPAPKGTGFVI